MISKNIKITKIHENIFRIEKNRFSNINSLFIPTKDNFLDLPFQYKETKEEIIISYLEYKIHVKKKENIVNIKLNNKRIHKFNFDFTNGELPKPIDTPLFFHINDTPKIELKKGGYTIKEPGNNSVFEDSLDMYIMFTNKNHKLLRYLFTFLTKSSEFVRLSTLGCFDSRYYPYYDKEALNLIDKFNEYDLPLDNFVIDTDWRKAKDRGIGYDINISLFPNMKEFLNECHKRNIEIMFNDHPEPVNPSKDIFNNEEIKYRESNLKNILSLGLDYWWYDRNWITKLISPSNKIPCETLGMYAFSSITKNYNLEVSKDEKHYKRPIIMGNIVNIANGVYKNISDIASHRYSIQWSGDIICSISSLTQEVANMIKCSSNCLAYYSSDLGGHVGNPTKEEYIKWIKFGAFQPIFRPHCTCSVERFREPFNYDEETVNIFRDYVNLRYRLLPLMYKFAYETYYTGIPFIRALSLNYPLDKKANNNYSTFMLGDKLLISPFIEDLTSPITKENYIGKVKAKYYNNIYLEGDPISINEYDILEFDINGNSIEKNVNPYDFTAEFEFKLCFKEDVTLYAAIDDGSIFYIDNKEVYKDWTYHGACITKIVELNKDTVYNFKLKYLQGGGEGKVALYKQIRKENKTTKVYLPNDEWFNLFDGKLTSGNKYIKFKNSYEFLPLFVKCGSLIPLVKEVNNTTKIDWKNFIFDYFPSKNIKESDYIYEDDHYSIAYQYNEFRKTKYSIFFDKESNSYILKIDKANGSFNGSDLLKDRNIIFKFENIFKEKVEYITINGKTVSFDINKKDTSLFPLSYSLP